MEEDFLETAVEAAHRAGEIILNRLEAHRDVTVKGLRDIVTDADIAAEEAILEIITERFPEHSIYSEERPFQEGDTPFTWFIDPLDGTTNYSRRFPCFSTSIALAEKGQVIVGVVYNPLLNHLFTAEKGKGACLNGKPIHVSKRAELMKALVALDWVHSQQVRRKMTGIISRLALSVGTLRTMGSASLGFCFVAAGWTDAYFHLGLKPWDLAAGALMVEEAGGKVTRVDGSPWSVEKGGLLASNGLLHSELLKFFVAAGIQPD